MITTWGIIQTIVGQRHMVFVFRPLEPTESAEHIYQGQVAGHLLVTIAMAADSNAALKLCEVWFISFNKENNFPKFEKVC